MEIARRNKILLGLALLLMAAADVYAIAGRVLQVNAPPMSLAKVVGASFIQALVLAGGYLYLAWLERQPRLELPPYGSFGSLRSRIVPILILVVIAGLGVSLFYNGVVCGDLPMPTVRGRGLCA